MEIIGEGNVGGQYVKVGGVIGYQDVGLVFFYFSLLPYGIPQTSGEENPMSPNFFESPGMGKPVFTAEQYKEYRIEGQEKKESTQEKPNAPKPSTNERQGLHVVKIPVYAHPALILK